MKKIYYKGVNDTPNGFGKHLTNTTMPNPALWDKIIIVDASTTGGNPGYTEYRGLDYVTKETVFHNDCGTATNNIGEIMAIIDGLCYLENNKLRGLVYSDSTICISWARRRIIKTNMHRDWPQKYTIELDEILKDGLARLKALKSVDNVLFWRNSDWGENLADFGRK